MRADYRLITSNYRWTAHIDPANGAGLANNGLVDPGNIYFGNYGPKSCI